MNDPAHITPRSSYYKIFAALMVLTAATVLVATVDLGVFNALVAMTIAIIKAMLVLLFFMHVKESSGLTKVFVFAGVFWLLIMFVLTLSDFLTRGWLPRPQGW